MNTVWIYVNTSKQLADPDHLKVFANADAAETCKFWMNRSSRLTRNADITVNGEFHCG